MILKKGLPALCLLMILSLNEIAQGQDTLSYGGNKSENRLSSEWRFSLSGMDNSDQQSQSKTVSMRADFKTKYLLSESLNLDIQPSVRLQTGQIQSVTGDDTADNKILLNQAAVHFVPSKAFKFSAGALSQTYLHTGLLIDPIAFPAARAEGTLQTGYVQTSLVIETAIPTSTSLSTNTKQLEPTPSLNSTAAIVDWRYSKDFFWKTQLGYFIYGQLPSSVAQQSGLLGNDVSKISDANYNFVYEYEGIEAASEFKFPVLKPLDLLGGAQYVVNQKAPSDLNSAYLYFLGGEFHLTKSLDLTLRGSYFSIAPEAAVAYFNANGFQTNRVGYSLESSLSFKKRAFSVGLKYTDSEIMFSSTTQSHEKIFSIKLETFYASI
ncbi:MAG: hypothetical protein ACXVCR_19580 [Bdellovibrio sp.]